MKRGWVGFVVLVGLAWRTALILLLFWGIHPLWLVLFWRLQGYPITLPDLQRWYAPGAFNIVPTLAWLTVGLLLTGVLMGLQRRLPRRWMVIGMGAVVGVLAVPPLAYALLLIYAGVWHYRAWDVMMPTLWRAYLMLAPSCALVGATAGWLSYTKARLKV